MEKFKSAFISYSTDASIRASQITGYLKPLGIDTFDFKRDMGAGANVPKTVRDAIRARDAIILILSVKARASTWVASELGFAAALEKPIIVYKTAHNLELPDYLEKFDYRLLSKLEDLDQFFTRSDS